MVGTKMKDWEEVRCSWILSEVFANEIYGGVKWSIFLYVWTFQMITVTWH